MQALLIVNPHATSVTPGVSNMVTRMLGAGLDLTVAPTDHRGHAAELARTAAAEGRDVVITLGGDGTLNEAVNGLLRDAPGDPDRLPAVAALPGGSANVFVRSLGLPRDLRRCTVSTLDALRRGRRRRIGLGRAEDRYFTFCAGLGLDAEVVRDVEAARAAGHRASPSLYIRTTVRRFFATDRQFPALTVERPHASTVHDVFLGIVSNTAPWTYAGLLPVNPNPRARLAEGLDLLAARRLDLPSSLGLLCAMLSPGGVRDAGLGRVALHDAGAFTLRATRPTAFQLDGEYLGEREHVDFTAVANALRIVV